MLDTAGRSRQRLALASSLGLFPSSYKHFMLEVRVKSHHKPLSRSAGTKPASLTRCVTQPLRLHRSLDISLAQPRINKRAFLHMRGRAIYRALLSASTFGMSCGLSVGHSTVLHSRPASSPLAMTVLQGGASRESTKAKSVTLLYSFVILMDEMCCF